MSQKESTLEEIIQNISAMCWILAFLVLFSGFFVFSELLENPIVLGMNVFLFLFYAGMAFLAKKAPGAIACGTALVALAMVLVNSIEMGRLTGVMPACCGIFLLQSASKLGGARKREEDLKNQSASSENL